MEREEEEDSADGTRRILGTRMKVEHGEGILRRGSEAYKL